MKVIIAGSRTIMDYCIVAGAIYESEFHITVVLSGMAPGVDLLGWRWGKLHGKKVEEHHADWKKHGKGAGIIRNSKMALEADALIAVWDGKSKGTLDMIEKMKKLGKLTFVKVIETDVDSNAGARR